MAFRVTMLVLACVACIGQVRRLAKHGSHASFETKHSRAKWPVSPGPAKLRAALLLAIGGPTVGWHVSPALGSTNKAGLASSFGHLAHGRHHTIAMANEAVLGWRPEKTLADDSNIFADGSKALPDGTKVVVDDTKLMPDGTLIGTDGSVTPRSHRLNQAFKRLSRSLFPKRAKLQDDGAKAFDMFPKKAKPSNDDEKLPSKRILIGNLPLVIDATTLKNTLGEGVEFIHWIPDKTTGLWYGSTFVQMRSEKDARRLVDLAKEGRIQINNMKIRLNFAPPTDGEEWPPPDFQQLERPRL